MRNLSKRNVAIILVFIITAFTFLLAFGALKKTAIEDVSSQKIKIVLDAGHGGIDGGAIGVKTGVKESDINLNVVKKLKDHLLSLGFNVILTRNDE